MDVLERYHQEMRKMNSHNVAGFIMSYLNRTDLGLVRELDPTKREFARCIEIDTALVSGEYAVDLTRAMTDMNGRMDPAKTQFISVSKLDLCLKWHYWLIERENRSSCSKC